jgi:hypothetical protein
MYTLINGGTKLPIRAGFTLSTARNYCEQNLLTRAVSDRTMFLSDLAAGYIQVYQNTYVDGFKVGF